jgi:exodeoxyribonuclease VII large subunit
VTGAGVTDNSAATTPEAPWPVRTVARKIAAWIDRLGAVWVEGQVTQISAKPGTGTAFLTLRDPVADVSVTLTCATALVRDRQPPLTAGWWCTASRHCIWVAAR